MLARFSNPLFRCSAPAPGGGGGPDETPDTFTLTDVSGATTSTQYTSNTVVIAGLGGGVNATVSISGGSAQYSKNGAAYTGTSGTVANGDTLAVRLTSSGSASTPVTGTLTVGTYAENYTVTTAAGGSSPAAGHSGYNHSTQSMTSSTMHLDFRSDVSTSNTPLWFSTLSSRNARKVYKPTGGFYGGGYMLCMPGWDGLGQEQYCGVGQVLGLDTAGDARFGQIGFLVKYGSSFWDAQPSDIKQIIMLRGGNDRPMSISKEGTTTRVLAACDGTVCNTTSSASGTDYHNNGNNVPDIEDYDDVWCYFELQWNTTATNRLRTKLWTSDSTQLGTTIQKTMASAPGDEVTALDIVNFINSVSADLEVNGIGIEYLSIRVGIDADLTPPQGFPGSTR